MHGSVVCFVCFVCVHELTGVYIYIDIHIHLSLSLAKSSHMHKHIYIPRTGKRQPYGETRSWRITGT